MTKAQVDLWQLIGDVQWLHVYTSDGRLLFKTKDRADIERAVSALACEVDAPYDCMCRGDFLFDLSAKKGRTGFVVEVHGDSVRWLSEGHHALIDPHAVVTWLSSHGIDYVEGNPRNPPLTTKPKV